MLRMREVPASCAVIALAVAAQIPGGPRRVRQTERHPLARCSTFVGLRGSGDRPLRGSMARTAKSYAARALCVVAAPRSIREGRLAVRGSVAA